MLTRAHVENIIGFCTGKANMQEFQSYTAPGFVFEIMGTQPAAGEWHGIEAMKRQFEAFKENFTSEFQFNASGIYGRCPPAFAPAHGQGGWQLPTALWLVRILRP